jgi:hypothetical protein
LVFILHINIFSQTNEPTNQLTFFTKLSAFFPPTFFEAELRLKQFIRSKRFSYIKKQNGELASIDTIFSRAKYLTNDNPALALLLSTLATNDHCILYFRFPIFDFRLPFPLTLETKEEFQQRFNNLPRYFLSQNEDHRDKLQHFFASAFLSYIFESEEVVNRFGIFVEKGENAFVEDGTYDVEDLKMNRLGAEFGTELNNNSQLAPSLYFPKPKK